MDRGAWWAPVLGVAKSRTQLSNWAHTGCTPPGPSKITPQYTQNWIKAKTTWTPAGWTLFVTEQWWPAPRRSIWRTQWRWLPSGLGTAWDLSISLSQGFLCDLSYIAPATPHLVGFVVSLKTSLFQFERPSWLASQAFHCTHGERDRQGKWPAKGNSHG